jgi:hypothetical protein
LVLALLGSGIFSFKQHRDIKKQSEDIKTKNTQLKAANKKLKVAQENMKQQIAAAKEHYKNKEVPQFVQVIEQVFETLVNDLVGFDLFKETDTKQKKTKNKGSAPLSTPLKNKKPKKNIEITDQVDTQEKVDITKNHNPFLVDGDQANPGLKEIKV